jgi:hypothetical protein
MSARVCLVSESPRSLPGFTSWPTFPFEGDIRIKKLDELVAVEPPRHGENPSECRACSSPDEAYIWVSERWRVRSLDRPTGLPMVLILESRSHLDLGDLPNLLAAELGVMTVRLERAVRSLDGVARVHVNRWGDGSAHLHLWFLARPYGRLQLRGTFLSLWDEILPTIPESQWRENLALVAAWLAEFGGRPLAEPPRIDWKAPASLGSDGPANAGEASEPARSEPAGPGVAGGPGPSEDRRGILLRAMDGDLVERAVPGGGPAGSSAEPARSIPTPRVPVDRADAERIGGTDRAGAGAGAKSDYGLSTTADDIGTDERAPIGTAGGADRGGADRGGADGGDRGGVAVPARSGPDVAGTDSPGANVENGTMTEAGAIDEPGADAAGAKTGGAKTGGAKVEASASAAGRADGANASEPAAGARPAGAVKSVSGSKQSERGKQSGRSRSGGVRDRG